MGLHHSVFERNNHLPAEEYISNNEDTKLLNISARELRNKPAAKEIFANEEHPIKQLAEEIFNHYKSSASAFVALNQKNNSFSVAAEQSGYDKNLLAAVILLIEESMPSTLAH